MSVANMRQPSTAATKIGRWTIHHIRIRPDLCRTGRLTGGMTGRGGSFCGVGGGIGSDGVEGGSGSLRRTNSGGGGKEDIILYK